MHSDRIEDRRYMAFAFPESVLDPLHSPVSVIQKVFMTTLRHTKHNSIINTQLLHIFIAVTH